MRMNLAVYDRTAVTPCVNTIHHDEWIKSRFHEWPRDCATASRATGASSAPHAHTSHYGSRGHTDRGQKISDLTPWLEWLQGLIQQHLRGRLQVALKMWQQPTFEVDTKSANEPRQWKISIKISLFIEINRVCTAQEGNLNLQQHGQSWTSWSTTFERNTA
jgi:hypothetical protein